MPIVKLAAKLLAARRQPPPPDRAGRSQGSDPPAAEAHPLGHGQANRPTGPSRGRSGGTAGKRPRLSERRPRSPYAAARSGTACEVPRPRGNGHDEGLRVVSTPDTPLLTSHSPSNRGDADPMSKHCREAATATSEAPRRAPGSASTRHTRCTATSHEGARSSHLRVGSAPAVTPRTGVCAFSSDHLSR